MSSNKTANLQLNQWQAGDAFLREEFNQDNGKIDAAVGALMGNGSCVAGRFQVTGTSNLKIELGFRPKFVMLWGYCSSKLALGLVFPNGCEVFDDAYRKDAAGAVLLTDYGFLIVDADKFNYAANTSTYAAFR